MISQDKAQSFLDSLKDLLKQNNQPVTEIEMTSGNYDRGEVIKEEVPTITTDLCEIGIYTNNLYFTVIIYSDSFSKKLFNTVKKFDKVQIYGFKNFLEDYYPAKNFSFEKLETQIKNENLFQIQFNFDFQKLTPKKILKKYLEIKTVIENISVKIVNQLTENLGPSKL